ncbi:surfactant protein C-like [Rhinophrynus dorsalis]
MNTSKQTLGCSIIVLILLAIIVVGATLIGVYMTQKHTEAVVEMAFEAKNGEKVHQTVMVNSAGNIAAFYVNTNNISSIILFDYNQNVIVFRRLSGPKCYVMHMNKENAPTMNDILMAVRRFKTQNATIEKDLAYNFIEQDEADRTKLGIAVNIICTDVPIYWATMNKSAHLRWKITIKFNIFGIEGSFVFES